MKPFKSILAFQKEFDTNEKCREYLELQLWNGTPVCPYCNSAKAYKLTKGQRYNCANSECKRTFSVTVGTVFENTKIPLTKWFYAMYILSVHSKGISSLQLSIWLGVTQKTAWFLNHRIREMLKESEALTFGGSVEADETFVGGKLTNRHQSAHVKREAREKRRQQAEAGQKVTWGSVFDSKTPVFGMVERGGKVITKVSENIKGKELRLFVRWNVVAGATVYTDEFRGYKGLDKFYKHETVNHASGEFVRGNAHTNTIEGFWSLLKRQIVGIHHSVSPQHLQRYCNEASYRYNNRALAQDERFTDTLKRCHGRLTYTELIKKAE